MSAPTAPRILVTLDDGEQIAPELTYYGPLEHVSGATHYGWVAALPRSKAISHVRPDYWPPDAVIFFE